ncbi:dynamin family protein [Nakamurella sp.]|uniref:dynamin family protein n=1 Tax=Nakamurella sp. TaxID=1869182 RepID=UPI003782EA9E
MADPLTSAVADLLRTAATQATGPAPRAQLVQLSDRLAGPLRLAIAGKIKAGKSTLLNALLGEELAPTDAGECTRIVTWYRHGDAPQVVVHPHGEPAQTAYFTRESGALEVDLAGRAPDLVDRIEVFWPTTRLREVTLVDTPGIASISTDLSARTLRVLTPDDHRPPEVDAVLYLLRHTHASDLRFLESFHDDDLLRGSSLNTVGVLSRADEIGSCRLDALEVAERVGRRYQADPRLRRLCPVIVPVAGLLGYAGQTLREPEFRSLATLAAAPRPECDALLLTADRFATRPSTIAITELERAHLLARLGLFGVRLAVDLIRRGEATSATALSADLTRRSGLNRLRTVLLRQFTDRAKVLKAHSALVSLEAILRAGGCDQPDALRAAAEQITASAHAFEEIRLLDQLRAGALRVPADHVEELDRLLGGAGHDPASRLGLVDDAAGTAIAAAALDALDRWQRLAEHPLSARTVQVAARGAGRTLEGLLAQATDPVTEIFPAGGPTAR